MIDARKNWLQSVCFILATLFALSLLSWSAQAQDEPTATPDAEGVIYDEVRPNDSLWAIAGRAGISLDELLALNGLSESDIIQPGQQLIIGYGTPPATETPDLPPPTATATLPPPTITVTALPPARTAVCVTTFDDRNRDGLHNPGEPLRIAVALTLYNDVEVVGNYVTDGNTAVYCFEDLAPGEYTITRSYSADEFLTTVGEQEILLARGSVVNLLFGSYRGQVRVTAVAITPTTQSTNNNAPPLATAIPDTNETPSSIWDNPLLRIGLPLIGILISIGVLLLIGALIWFIYQQNGPHKKREETDNEKKGRGDETEKTQ